MSDKINNRLNTMSKDELLKECLQLKKKNQHLETVLRDYQALAEQHQFTQFAVDHLEMGAFWTTREGTLIYVNDAAGRFLGYTKDELLKLSVSDFDSTSLRGETWDAHWEHIREMKQFNFETRLRRKDGTLIPVEIVINHVEFHGVEFHCSFFRDLSKEKAARQSLEREHRFNQYLIEAAPVMILVIDAEGNIVRSNPRFETVTGYTHDEVQNKPFLPVFFREKDQEKVRHLFETSISRGLGETPMLPILTKAGNTREVVWHGKKLVDESDNTIGLLVIGQDVTDRRQMESRLRHSEKMEAIGLLAGGIAHDFNNQLGGILGYAEILKEELYHDNSLSAYLNAIILAVRRASDLTGQLLAFSRKGKYARVPLNLNKIVLEVVDILRHSIDKRIVIEHELMHDVAQLEGDASQLQNAVLNLAINARDAMPDGGRLRFETKEIFLDAEFGIRHSVDISIGKHICLTVSDTGIGMEEVVIERMFEPFFTTKKESEGTGMGLAAVYGTISQHKGAITVNSEIDRGTTIKVFIPALESNRSPAESVPPPSIDSPSKGVIRVLLAEDEPVLRRVATEMLERLGCTVTPCSDGEAAVALFSASAEALDLVILDMGMPKLNGKEAYMAMKARNADVPIIVVSGYSSEGDAKEILEAGACAFLQKPYRARELSRVITETLGDKKRA